MELLAQAPVQWIVLGVGALILLVLVLRFALRPRRRKETPPTGLNIPATSKSSLWGRPAAPGAPPAPESTSTWAAPVGPSSPAGPPVQAPVWNVTPDGRGLESPAPVGTGLDASRPGVVTGSPAEMAALAESESRSGRGGPAGHPDAASRASAATRVAPADPRTCPKCGGRFLDGEMEGPTLMIDGVARDDFQPLLTARECAQCGYLEFYTRPVKG